jgi:hypothetical protein
MKVLVNDNLLTLILSALAPGNGSGFLTDGVTVTLSSDSASSASFSIVDCYDATLRHFKRILSVGSKICILMGYGSALLPVFAGYVDGISYEFSEKPVATVTAFDAVKLMRESGAVERTWDDGRFYTATILEIMADYADICPLPVTNILPTLKTHGHLQQNSNNYDYIKQVLCKYCDRDLLVRGGYAFLVDAYLQFGKLTDLGFGFGLTRLSVTPSYKKVQATVTGDKLSGAMATSTVKTGDSYKSSMNKPERLSVSAPLKTAADCKLFANRLASDAAKEAQRASGSCVGIPDLVPGVGLGFFGVDAAWSNRTYYVDTATHTFNASGYTTSFTTKGWN